MMRFITPSLAAVIVITLVRIIDAQQNITPSTCADPDGFSACYQEAISNSQVCTASAGGDANSINQCSCDFTLAEINCAIESCWNVVYGCEYQSLAFYWDSFCFGTLGDIPYFPAPEDAPGGCSCNLGQILGNYTSVGNFYTSCVSASGDTIACGCCQQGGELTSVYSFCPEDDLSVWGLSGIEDVLSAADWNPSGCEPYFNQYDCVNDLNYPPIGTLSYLTAFPSSTGTLDPSTTAGTITAPLCGSTCVLTVGGTETTITPLGANAAGTAAASAAATGDTSQQSSGSTKVTPGRARSTGVAHSLLSLYLFMVCFAISSI